MDLSNGLISGVQTAARLTPRQMMIIAERRLTGSSPVRPELGPEYATAILWAEAALGKALPPHREEIERFLNRARLEHNNNWISPAGETFNSTELFYLQSAGQYGNFPNEEFFVRRIETSPEISTGFQLRLEEEEVVKRETQNSSLDDGAVVQSMMFTWRPNACICESLIFKSLFTLLRSFKIFTLSISVKFSPCRIQCAQLLPAVPG